MSMVGAPRVGLLSGWRGHSSPGAAAFTYRVRLADSDRGNFFQDLEGQLFNGVKSLDRLDVAARPVHGERGQPESDLGGLLGKVFHLWLSYRTEP